MEEVFASAYCTIVSSSVSHWKDSFLDRTQALNQFEGNIHFGKNVNEFRELVDKGSLNKRAWVLQERALSH